MALRGESAQSGANPNAVMISEDRSSTSLSPILVPGLVLAGYAAFMVFTYGKFLDWNLRLRSPDLAGLPEDVIGYGFWMWWPFVALILAAAFIAALSNMRRRLSGAAVILGAFGVLSVVDYLLCQRLVQELTRPV